MPCRLPLHPPLHLNLADNSVLHLHPDQAGADTFRPVCDRHDDASFRIFLLPV